MMRRYIWLLGLGCASLSFASEGPLSAKAKDLYLGEALYYASQGKYVDAISMLDTELGGSNVAALRLQAMEAESMAGDFELSYRMHQPAGRAIKAIAEGGVEPSKRNEMIYRLARLLMQKNQPAEALRAIDKISGPLPENIRNDERSLRAQIYMANGKSADAVKILHGLADAKGVDGLAAYSLGVALIQSRQEQKGLEQLDKTGQLKGDDEVTLAIRDKANVGLGLKQIESGKPKLAKQYLDRVRLTGPYSNKALLGAGWAEAALGNFDRALVPWSELAKRNISDKAVQESMLDVPYAYARLNMYGKAAVLYGKALDGFDLELSKLDKSLKSIRAGKFVQALFREELKQDRSWLMRLRDVPDAPETYYLLELIASNNFQGVLQNYLDLEELQKKLDAWDRQLDSYEDMLEVRRKYYEPLLLNFDKQFMVLESQFRTHQTQREGLDGLLKKGEAKQASDASKPQAPPKTMMQEAPEQVLQFEERYNSDAGGVDEYVQRRLNWKIYGGGKNSFEDYTRQLDAGDETLVNTYASLNRVRKAAIQSYEGYGDQIRQFRNHMRESREKLKPLLARQAHVLEVMAINELEQRRKRIEEYQVQAGTALSESYARAARPKNAGGKAK